MNDIEMIQNFKRLVTERVTLDATLDVIRKYFVPHRGEFFDDTTSEHSIDWRDTRDVYDTTGIDAADKLAANVQSALTNPSMKWFGFNFRDETLNADHAARAWLDECENITWRELKDSNFDVESSEFYLDIVSFGTAVLSEEAESELDWKGLNFKAAPMVDCYFEESTDGKILRFYHRFEWDALQIIDKFGSAPDWIKEHEERAASEKHEVILVVYPVKANADADVLSVLSADKRPYAYKYLLTKDASQLGETGGYYDMPSFIARWRKVSGSKWGYSPAHIALADVLTLNQITEDSLEALGKVIDPAILTTSRGLLSDLDLRRAGVTVVRDIGDVVPFESRARFDIGELKMDKLESRIRSTFYIDQLELKESPAMTATEVNARADMVLKLMGPTSGRMINDFLDPCLKRTFRILSRANQFPPAPESVTNVGAAMDIEYTGPMPRAQRQDMIQSIQGWTGMVAQLAEINPQVLDIPDWDKITREVAKISGIPAKLTVDQKVVDKQRAEQAKKAEQQRQVELAHQGGEAMTAVGQGVKELGPDAASTMMEQTSGQ